MIPSVALVEILENYQALLLDSYGVLVDHRGALPGAPELISHLKSRSLPWRVLTNDASKPPEIAARRYQSLGLNIGVESIVSSGMLVTDYLLQNGLSGAPVLLFGPQQAAPFVLAAGCELVPLAIDAEPAVIALMDEDNQPFFESLNLLISLVLKLISKRKPFHFLEANPDLIFPVSADHFGIASGSVAAIVAQAVNARFPHGAEFNHVKLGKPYRPIFERALQGLENMRPLMIGDQILTDVAGAKNVGVDSGLMVSGVIDVSFLNPESAMMPDYYITSLMG